MMRINIMKKLFCGALMVLGLGGCTESNLPPTQLAGNVDIQRYMGKWYLVGNIPHWVEKGAHNATETYTLAADGTIPTVFTFNKDAPDGPVKTITSTAYTTDNPAILGVQFIWPIKAEYRIMYLNEDYSQVVVGRNKRDYAWIMARTPKIPDADFEKMKQILADEGYDISKLIKVPQQVK